MRFLFLSLFIYLASSLPAQGYFLPYLQDGKYGIADEEGKILIQPKYEAAIPAPGLHLFKVKQNGLWGCSGF